MFPVHILLLCSHIKIQTTGSGYRFVQGAHGVRISLKKGSSLLGKNGKFENRLMDKMKLVQTVRDSGLIRRKRFFALHAHFLWPKFIMHHHDGLIHREIVDEQNTKKNPIFTCGLFLEKTKTT